MDRGAWRATVHQSQSDTAEQLRGGMPVTPP